MRDIDSFGIRKTRRAVIAGLAAAMSTAAVGAPSLGFVVSRVAVPLSRASMADWSRLVGSKFVVDGEKGRWTVQLVAVRAFTPSGPRPADFARTQAFVAVFEAAASPVAPAGDRTYRFTHAEQGIVDLFVGPVAAGAGGRMQLNAVLN